MGKHRFVVDGQSFDIEVLARDAQHAEVVVNGEPHRVELAAPADAPRAAPRAMVAAAPRRAPSHATSSGHGAAQAVRAPMAGLVLAISVKPGQRVTAGEELVVLDAMKMENTLSAPSDGVVGEIAVSVGATVMHGALLLHLGAG